MCPYGKHFSHHGLKLLFWFAQRITSADQNNVLQVNFKPSRGDFGFHWIQNYDHILPTKIKGFHASLLLYTEDG